MLGTKDDLCAPSMCDSYGRLRTKGSRSSTTRVTEKLENGTE
jgi:hypothetical protein